MAQATTAKDQITFTILANGKEVEPSYQVFSMDVRKEMNRIPTATICLEDGDVMEKDFEVSNTKDFIPGAEIEIKAGYSGKEESIFKGVVVKHSIQIRNRKSELIIECADQAIKMTSGKKSGYFYKQKDSAVIEKIIGTYSKLSKKVDATKEEHKELVQYQSTDWDFVVNRAEVNHLFLFVNDGEITITEPDASSAPVLKVSYGDNLIELDAEVDATNQFKKVTGYSWDPASQKIVKSVGKDSSFKTAGNLAGKDLHGVVTPDELDLKQAGQVTDQELQAWADSCLFKSVLSRLVGRVRFEGNADVVPGTVIELEGVGKRFSGNAFVCGVRHEICNGNWLTDAQLGADAAWFSDSYKINESPASGLISAIPGLQIGIVTKIDGDPDGEDRIQIKTPIIDTEADGIWARVATPDAGNKRGIFFRPEKDDEVVIGFLNDDPRNPIVLGMMNSSKLPAPLTAEEKNNEKGMVTRSEVKMIVHDEDVSFTISTPKGNTIVLTEKDEKILIEDQSKNKIEMTSSGILLDSPKDIEIKAKGDVKIEGPNVEIKAKAQFKANGGAGAELKTDAIAVVKGSMVQIN